MIGQLGFCPGTSPGKFTQFFPSRRGACAITFIFRYTFQLPPATARPGRKALNTSNLAGGFGASKIRQNGAPEWKNPGGALMRGPPKGRKFY